MKDVRGVWLVLVILMCSWSMASAQDFEIEPWEKRLNARQPPDQVMDAIELTPGMVVGEVGAGNVLRAWCWPSQFSHHLPSNRG